jgi:hypothetical protein
MGLCLDYGVVAQFTLRGRNFINQKVEAKIMANILNKMTQLGMPKSKKLEANRFV